MSDPASEVRDRVPVLVVGAGPAGLSATLLLRQRGVDALLLERRATPSHLPRAHLLNQRTMEIFTDLGVADAIYAISPAEDRWHRVVWRTSIGGPGPLQGLEIGHRHAWGGDEDVKRYAAGSPRMFANVPQMRLDPMLARRVEEQCPGRLRFHHEVLHLAQDDDGVTARVRDLDSGEEYAVHARYVIAADGGRLCGDLLGVSMKGQTKLMDMVTLHVSADLSPWLTDDQALLTYLVSPFGQGNQTGAICAMGPDRWGKDSEEWAMHQAFKVGDPASRDTDAVLTRALEVFGIPDADVRVHVVSHWEFEGLTAEHFRVGSVFLVGNAAHRHPPTGGLGLNTAVQDVHNLVWKIALVLDGVASDGLLDTYESERKPVGTFNVEHSVRNADGHRRIAAALGQRAGQSEAEGWDEIAVWQSDTPEGERRRAAVAEAVASNGDDYSQLNVELGFAYENGALVPDGSPPPATHDSLTDLTQTTRPGHAVPHAWVERDGQRVSVKDLVSDRRFTLLVHGDHQEAWSAALATVVRETGVEVGVVAISGSSRIRDADGAWSEIVGTGESGAVLVRPDRHVAWRADPPHAQRAELLGAALRTVLTGGPGAGDAAPARSLESEASR